MSVSDKAVCTVRPAEYSLRTLCFALGGLGFEFVVGWVHA